MGSNLTVAAWSACGPFSGRGAMVWRLRRLRRGPPRSSDTWETVTGVLPRFSMVITVTSTGHPPSLLVFS